MNQVMTPNNAMTIAQAVKDYGTDKMANLMTARFCPRCGHQVKVEYTAKFTADCLSCGFALQDDRELATKWMQGASSDQPPIDPSARGHAATT